MDGVGAALQNAIDEAVVAAESMPDVSVRSASDAHKILNLVNVEISMYGDSDIENVKIALPHHLSISWKKFGISKVHEIFFSAKCSNKIQWKMQSQDKDFTKATFLIKSKNRTLIKKVRDINSNESEGSPDENCDDSDISSDNESSTNMEGDDAEIEINKENERQQNAVSKLSDSQLVPLNFDDVDLISWVLVLYEGEKFLGRVLTKAAGKFEVQCLQKPYGIRNAQQFELDAIYYRQVYEASIKPWATELDDDGNRTRKTFYKY